LIQPDLVQLSASEHVAQEISARLGRVTGHGIAGNMQRYYPAWMLYVIVSLLIIANVINIGADVGAMGAALNLLFGGPAHLYCLLFALVSVVLQVSIPYKNYSQILKWLTFSLFAYSAQFSSFRSTGPK
jgi:Mn2+/Fe2+ NRAMP family transporter